MTTPKPTTLDLGRPNDSQNGSGLQSGSKVGAVTAQNIDNHRVLRSVLWADPHRRLSRNWPHRLIERGRLTRHPTPCHEHSSSCGMWDIPLHHVSRDSTTRAQPAEDQSAIEDALPHCRLRPYCLLRQHVPRLSMIGWGRLEQICDGKKLPVA